MERSGIAERVGEENFYWSVARALSRRTGGQAFAALRLLRSGTPRRKRTRNPPKKKFVSFFGAVKFSFSQNRARLGHKKSFFYLNKAYVRRDGRMPFT